MQLLQENPYRILGLLASAKAREKEKQIRRLKQFIDADLEQDEDSSFPTMGRFSRTKASVGAAISKLNLDDDKMNAALFWFYKGNEITDLPAFDCLKDGSFQEAVSIWSSLTNGKNVDSRNASAFQNLSSLILDYAIRNNVIKDDNLKKGIKLKLKFLESEQIKEFKELVTDKTYKTSKKKLQLSFLAQLQAELETYPGFDSAQLIKILNGQEFLAKDDFLKKIIKKPIKKINNHIEKTASNREADGSKALNFGLELYEDVHDDLILVKSILGVEDITYSSLADKMSEEVLQCGIDHFKFYKDSETDPGLDAMELLEKANSMAVGNIVEQRCRENINNLQDWIDDKPQREKRNSIKAEVEFIEKALQGFYPDIIPSSDILDQYQDESSRELRKYLSNSQLSLLDESILQSSVENIDQASYLIFKCKPELVKIRKALGIDDEQFLNLSSSVAQKAQELLVKALNVEMERSHLTKNSIFPRIDYHWLNFIKAALSITYVMERYEMHTNLRTNFEKNLQVLISIAEQFQVSTLKPTDRLRQQLIQEENKMKEIERTTFFKAELDLLYQGMDKIKRWSLFRTKEETALKIFEQQRKINQLIEKSEKETASKIQQQQQIIDKIETKLHQFEVLLN